MAMRAKDLQGNISRRSFLATSAGAGLVMGLGVVLPGCSRDQAVEEMAMALGRDDLEGSIAARKVFVDGCLAELNDVYLVSVLRALLPSALRLAHRAARHPGCEMRDTVRFHHALLEALSRGDDGRVAELVRAFGRREGQLAAECRIS